MNDKYAIMRDRLIFLSIVVGAELMINMIRGTNPVETVGPAALLSDQECKDSKTRLNGRPYHIIINSCAYYDGQENESVSHIAYLSSSSIAPSLDLRRWRCHVYGLFSFINVSWQHRQCRVAAVHLHTSLPSSRTCLITPCAEPRSVFTRSPG